MSFSVRQAQLVGLFMESSLYGMLLITFGICLRHFLWDPQGHAIPASQVKRGVLSLASALFTVSTLDIALGVVNDYTQLLLPGDKDDLNTPPWLTVTRTALLCLQNLLGEAIMIYRCWIVYNRRLSIIVAPSILFLGGLALSILIAVLEPNVDGPLTQAGTTTSLIVGVYSVSFTLSLLTTALIVYRLWNVDRTLSEYERESPATLSHSPLGKMILLVIESGLMFTATELFCTLSFASNSNVSYVATYMDIQVIPIAFNLIIIRSHIDSGHEDPGGPESAIRTASERSEVETKHSIDKGELCISPGPGYAKEFTVV